MTAEEQVYALFVQANPVPDPAGLPLALEAPEPLLQPVDGRRRTMLTEERHRTEPPKPKRSWVRPVMAGVAALVVVVGIAVVSFGGETVPVAEEGEPVAAVDAKPVVTMDGTTVVYAGPALIATGEVEMTMVADFPDTGTMVVSQFGTREALDAELARVPSGTDTSLHFNDARIPNALVAAQITAAAGSTRSQAVSMVPGYYVIDAYTVSGRQMSHMWRLPTVIEVVE